jgi:hypothetical protein
VSARRTPRTEAVASALLATALGVIFTAALVHWIDLEGITTHPGPADAGTTAKAAALGLLARPRLALRQAWARFMLMSRLYTDKRKLEWIEQDIAAMQAEVAWLPAHIRTYQREASRLRVCIAVAERRLEPGEAAIVDNPGPMERP